MNSSVNKLSNIASKRTKKIIGLMSGTSLDGLDIALCNITGNGPRTEVELKKFVMKPYDSDTKKRLQRITSVNQVSMEEVCLQHSWLGELHGKFVLAALSDWDIAPSQIDCIASHGQTIYHAPQSQHQQADMPNATFQIGDGDHITHTTGILTISDFRQKHTAAGGEGAPMAALVDRMLFGDDSQDRILLNIGGIANFTYLPAQNTSAITTDTGPGNTLIDAAVRTNFNTDFDRDGKIARHGSVDSKTLSALIADPFFKQSMPKTTGPEYFNLEWIKRQLQQKEIAMPEPENLVATLTRLSAKTIAQTILTVADRDQHLDIFVSGGGVHNPELMNGLAQEMPDTNIQNFETIGFNPDAKEAVIFAVLANETLSGEGFTIDSNKKGQLNFGKISFPN